MAAKLPTIPKPNAQIPKVIADVLNPIRDAIEIRFLSRDKRERVVTRQDLVKLGIATETDINKLD